MVDTSDQNAALMHAHMDVLINILIRQEKFVPGVSTIWYHTNVCGKKYICSKALYLLIILACKYNLLIYRCVSTPGNCRYLVGGMNAQAKGF